MLLAIAVVCAWLLTCPPAGAAQPPPFDLGRVDAQRVVEDVILDSPPKLARSSRAVATAAFTDDEGREFTVDSEIPDIDLTPFAAVLGSIYHGPEISALQVHVVTLADIAALCGDGDAVACYLPTNPLENGDGEIWIAADDTDWVHTLVHEYGHHTDNQLFNLAHLGRWGVGMGCDFSGDGSRNWFFARQMKDDILSAGFGCNPESPWDRLLPELYAEDFVALNGITDWQLTTIGAPTTAQLRALKWDIDNGLYLGAKRYRVRVRKRRMQIQTVDTPQVSFLRVRVTGGPGRNFDIYVYKHGSRRYSFRSVRRGRVESFFSFIPAGKWDIGVRARPRGGVARVGIDLL